MRLAELMAAVLNVAEASLTDEASPSTVKEWDSLTQLGLISAVEETYDVTFDLDEMRSANSVGDFRKILASKGVHP